MKSNAHEGVVPLVVGDRTVSLQFTLRAFRLLEEQHGLGLGDIQAMIALGGVKASLAPVLVYAAAQRHQPELTLEQVTALLDEATYGDVHGPLLAALLVGMNGTDPTHLRRLQELAARFSAGA